MFRVLDLLVSVFVLKKIQAYLKTEALSSPPHIPCDQIPHPELQCPLLRTQKGQKREKEALVQFPTKRSGHEGREHWSGVEGRGGDGLNRFEAAETQLRLASKLHFPGGRRGLDGAADRKRVVLDAIPGNSTPPHATLLAGNT